MSDDADVVPMRQRRQRSPQLITVPEVAGDHLNAQRFLAEHGANVRRSPQLGRWFIWTGAWWQEDCLDQLAELAADTIDNLRPWVAEAADPQEFSKRSKHYEASAKAGRRDALLSIAGTDPDIVVAVEQLDAHPMLLACKNGTVDLATGEVHEPDRARLLTHGVNVEYDPEARSALWDGFLDRIFDADAELIAYVQRLLGYCLTGVVAEHILPVLSGVGANGKSTLIGVVQDLLGDLAVTAPDGLVIRRDHEPHPERLATLRGRRLVVSAELEQRAVLAEALVKVLTGGDTLSARELYGRRFNFKPTHKVVLVTNHRPRVPNTDHAIWRRLRVVPFDTVIPPEDQDPALRRRLVAEHAPAVLAWLVRGAMAWATDGLGEATAVGVATAEYREAEDMFGRWVDECCENLGDHSVRTKVGDLWESWKQWSIAAGERSGRLQDFVAKLTEHDNNIEVETHHGARYVLGLGLPVRAGEGSPRTFPMHPSRGTLRTSPNEPSPEDGDQGFYNRAEF